MFIKREIRDYLEDILQSVQDILEFVAGMDFPQFAVRDLLDQISA